MFVRESVSCRLTDKKKCFSSQSAVHQERKEGRGRANHSQEERRRNPLTVPCRECRKDKSFYDFRDVLLDKLIPENE